MSDSEAVTVDPQQPTPRALKGSPEALRQASVILETLCGLRTTQSASLELSIAVPRYYVLEARMLQAMVDALEPLPRGRKPDHEARLLAQSEELGRAQRELQRLQALCRTLQRTVGIKQETPRKPDGKTGKTQRRRRPPRVSRGEKVLRDLQGSLARATPANMPAETQ